MIVEDPACRHTHHQPPQPAAHCRAIVQDRVDEIRVTTGTHLRGAVEAIGARFLPLASRADRDFSRVEEALPGMRALPPDLQQMRYALEHAFLDPMLAQVASLRTAIASEEPDLVITDAGSMDRAALFLDPNRPPSPLDSFGFACLPLDRLDAATFGVGLPPARDDGDRERYASLAAEFQTAVGAPGCAYADTKLAALGLPPLPCSVPSAFATLADAYLHATVPAFE